MEVITNGRSRREMEQRLNTLQTSLNAVETSIMKFKNLIENCSMVEEEVRCIEEDEAHQEEEEEETTSIEMVDEEERGNLESSGPCRETDTEDIPPLVSGGDTISPEDIPPLVFGGDTISPEEDTLLFQETPQPEDPVVGSHSPRSETSMVLGGMAKLCLTCPSHSVPKEDETPP